MFKATPVSYLMNGPFGSFAPTYDSAFATLTKMDSDLLLHTYGSDLGVSYSHRYIKVCKFFPKFPETTKFSPKHLSKYILLLCK